MITKVCYREKKIEKGITNKEFRKEHMIFYDYKTTIKEKAIGLLDNKSIVYKFKTLIRLIIDIK